jgi:hypothetical protein
LVLVAKGENGVRSEPLLDVVFVPLTRAK